MTIAFNEIPANLRVPLVYVEIDNTRAVQGASVINYRRLLLGQKTSAGSATAEQLVQITSAAQARSLFGSGSMLHHMAEAAFFEDDFVECWCMPLDDHASGVQAAGDILFGGTATAAGSINLYIGGRAVTAAVAVDDEGADIATAVAAAINADTDLSVTAAVNGVTAEQVDITAKNDGVAGNNIDIRLNYFADEALPAGTTADITAMTGGTNNPAISDALAALGDEWFHFIAMPYTDASNLTALESELADRFGPMRMIDGLAFASENDVLVDLSTLGNSRNSPHLSIMQSNGSPTPPWEWAASVTSVVAAAVTTGPASVTRPFQTLPLRWVKAPAIDKRFTKAENNVLLYDGIATHYIDAGGVVRIQALITTYKQNPLGADDISYLYANTLIALQYIRYDWRNYITLKYPRHKLADDDTRIGAGQPVITPKIGKAEAIAKFRQWEELGIVEDIDQFKNDLIVERNASNPNRLDFMLPPRLVAQLRIVGTQIQFLLLPPNSLT